MARKMLKRNDHKIRGAEQMKIDPITAGIVGFLVGLTVGHFWTKEDMEEQRG